MRRMILALAILTAACGGGAATTSTAPTTTSTAPTTTTTAATGTWFDGLAAGVCFDDAFTADGAFDFTVPAPVVPCDGPHANEIVARVSLGSGAFPGDTIATTAEQLCAAEFTRFLSVPVEETALAGWNVTPSSDDWEAGARDAICAVYGPEPLAGSAASAGLIVPGEGLALLAISGGAQTLWIVETGTGEVIADLAETGLRPTGVPSWAPDSSAIAVSHILSDTDHDIVVIDAAGSDPIGTVEGPDLDETPAIAPVGARIAYASNPEGGDFDIFLLDLDTGVTTRLTTNPGRDSDPQWSPDGSMISFRARVDGNADIYVMNADGTDLRRLTTDSGFDGDARWSPDGTRILFTSDRAGSYDLWLMDIDGSDQRPLTFHPADEEYPTWSSDGQYIAFQTNRHGVDQVWVMRADGTSQSLLIGTVPTAFPMFAPTPPD